MKLIVGLGNPGREYAGTRHNIGFGVIARLADEYHISLNSKEHKAVCGKGFIEGEKVILADNCNCRHFESDYQIRGSIYPDL